MKVVDKLEMTLSRMQDSVSVSILIMYRGELSRLAARQLAGGPVGPPARWAANSNVEVGYRERQSHKEGREGGNGTG